VKRWAQDDGKINGGERFQKINDLVTMSTCLPHINTHNLYIRLNSCLFVCLFFCFSCWVVILFYSILVVLGRKSLHSSTKLGYYRSMIIDNVNKRLIVGAK